jgi:DNA (cytosine-5)-methyltransferase 1
MPLTQESGEGDIEIFGRKFISPKLETNKLSDWDESVKWKTGGLAFGGIFVTNPVSSSPVSPTTSKFIEVVEKEKVAHHYFLSPNAIQGILRRVDKLGRNLFPPLDVVLRKILAEKSIDSVCIDSINEEDISLTDAIAVI